MSAQQFTEVSGALRVSERSVTRVAIGKQLFRKGVRPHVLEIGKNFRTDKYYVVVTFSNGSKATGEIAYATDTEIEYGASYARVDDEFIARCLMLQP